MNKIFFCLLFVWVGSLFSGGILDCLKKAENKGNDHKIRNIDFIYMINLDKRPERFALVKEQLNKYGINPYRFSAINGMSLSINEINSVGMQYKRGMNQLLAWRFVDAGEKIVSNQESIKDDGETYFGHSQIGAIGCSLSHISVLKDAWDSGYETIWVMEDDIEALEDPHRLSDLIEELDSIIGQNNWDVLFTDFDFRIAVDKYLPAYGAQKRPDMNCGFKERYSDKYMNRDQISDRFCKVSARFGTASMIIRRSGIKKLLNFSLNRNMYLPYDLENYFPEGIQRYGLTFDLVTNALNSISDISQPD